MKKIKPFLLLSVTLFILGLLCLPARADEYSMSSITINGTPYSVAPNLVVPLNNATTLNCSLVLNGSANLNATYTAKLLIGTSTLSETVVNNTVNFTSLPITLISYSATLVLYRNVAGSEQSIGTTSLTIVNFDANTPGTITSRSPSADQTGVSVKTNITVTINRPIASTTPDSITLTTASKDKTATAIACNISSSNSGNSGTITISPKVNLIGNTTYTVTLVAGSLKNLSGNSLLSKDESWSFTTDALGITDRYPSSEDDNFPIDHAITFEFTQEILPSTVKGSNIYLQPYNGSTKIAATVTYDSSKREVTLKPSKPLAYYTRYQVVVTNGVQDQWKQGITPTIWDFYTADRESGNALIYAKNPAADAINVATDQQLTFRFSTRMDEDTIDEDTVYLRRGSSSSDIDVDVKYDKDTRTVTMTPDDSLEVNTEYTIHVSSRIEDYDGDRIDSASWSFKTGNYEAAHIEGRNPSPNEDDVPLDTRITIDFADNLKSSTVKTSNIYLRRSGSTSNIKSDISYNSSDREVILAPLVDLLPDTVYTVYITSKVEDLAGNKLSATSWSFTTERRNRRLIYQYPESGAYQVPIDSQIRAGFSMPLTASTVNIGNCYLKRFGDFYGSNSMKVPVKVSYDATYSQIVFKPAAKLAYNTEYSVTIGNRVKDYTGSFISEITWSFTTMPDPTPRGTFDSPLVKMGSNYLSFNGAAQPYVKNGRTMVPFRTILEALGAEVDWDNSQQKITTILKNNTIELSIGKKTAYKNGKGMTLEAAPELRYDQTMIPLRFISEALGKRVTWDNNTCTVNIQ